MAVTQYIGARYVPKFFENSDGTEEWRAGVEYEPLTIVTYNSNSYTSKKPVPSNIGNPSDNPSYWVSTGVYNAQVEQLRQDVLQYKADAEEAIDETNERIDNLGQRKVIMITDSYADAGRGGFAKGIYTTFCTYAGLTDETNAWCYAKGGAGMAGAGQGVTFSGLADSAISAHSADAAEITDVFIAGGANDQDQTTADINNAKDPLFNKIHAAFPNAKIYIAMCAGFIPAAQRKLLMNKVRYVYYNGLPNKYIIPVMNAHLPMMIFNRFSDHVHPNAAGCTMIGKLLADVYRTGNTYGDFGTEYQSPANCNTPSSGSTQLLYARISTTKNGYEFMILGGSTGEGIGLSSSISITHNQGVTVDVGFCPTGGNIQMLCPNAESLSDTTPAFRIPCTIMAYTGDNTFTWIPLHGELYGVADASRNVTWTFVCRTAIKSATASQARWVPFKAQVF